MTDDQQQEQQGRHEQQGGRRRSTPAPDLASLVAYVRTDPVTGADHTVVGVVVAVDDQALTVRPLAGHTHRVTRDDVQVVTAEDDEV